MSDDKSKNTLNGLGSAAAALTLVGSGVAMYMATTCDWNEYAGATLTDSSDTKDPSASKSTNVQRIQDELTATFWVGLALSAFYLIVMMLTNYTEYAKGGKREIATFIVFALALASVAMGVIVWFRVMIRYSNDLDTYCKNKRIPCRDKSTYCYKDGSCYAKTEKVYPGLVSALMAIELIVLILWMAFVGYYNKPEKSTTTNAPTK
tara:strand:+ start:1304 stop:1921 length:618 start_codon:yes stop_codon:yes gene_type:complete